ncbi:MAG: glycosyltransferase family 4 protein [Candidatus Omnitrophota bacterium]
MKLLFCTPFYPYPLNIAGKVGFYNLLKHLSRHHDITLVALFDPREDEHSAALESFCAKVVTVGRKLFTLRQDLLSSFSPLSMSFVIRHRYNPEMRERIKSLANNEKFDVALYIFTQSAAYLQDRIGIPQVLIEEDILYQKAKRQFGIIKWTQPLCKVTNYIEYLKIRNFEIKAWAKADAIVTVTESDKQKIKGIAPRLKVVAIERGVDMEYYKPERKEADLKDRVMFLGAVSNNLNVDGARFFLEKIWPIILSKNPTAEFKIIGNGFGNIFNRDRYENIEEIGFVEDTRTYFNTSKVFVVPLLNSSGIRLKILEAMAAGCPVVTTRIGCEGINLSDGKDAFIRDDAAGFAEAVLELMSDTQTRMHFSKNAREKVARSYTWDLVTDKFNVFLEAITKDRFLKNGG